MGKEGGYFSPQPLSRQHLEETIALAESIFPFDLESVEAPRTAFTLSLDPDIYRAELGAMGIRSLSYWVIIYNQRVIAFTGLYQLLKESEDIQWLGWFGVDPEARGMGVGHRLLEWTMMRAQVQGAKVFKLYTSNAPNEAAAQRLYEKFGLKVVHEEPHGEYIYMFREKKL